MPTNNSHQIPWTNKLVTSTASSATKTILILPLKKKTSPFLVGLKPSSCFSFFVRSHHFDPHSSALVATFLTSWGASRRLDEGQGLFFFEPQSTSLNGYQDDIHSLYLLFEILQYCNLPRIFSFLGWQSQVDIGAAVGCRVLHKGSESPGFIQKRTYRFSQIHSTHENINNPTWKVVWISQILMFTSFAKF